MWNEEKQQRLDMLRQREQAGSLTDEERDSLEQLLYELEQDEWDRLRPALERLQQEQKQIQQEGGRLRLQNAVLVALVERQADLLRRAQAQLAGLLSEHEALKAEYEQITGQPLMGSLS